jgi:hypothetical protein
MTPLLGSRRIEASPYDVTGIKVLPASYSRSSAISNVDPAELGLRSRQNLLHDFALSRHLATLLFMEKMHLQHPKHNKVAGATLLFNL